MKDRLVILDLDGTLYDTRRVNFLAYQKALEDFGVALDEECFRAKCDGRYYKQFLPVIAPGSTPSDMEAIHRRKQALYREYLPAASVNEMLVEVMRSVRHISNIALVTSASRKNAEEILTFFGHMPLVDLLLTQEDVSRKKPDPEGFLLAMSHFGIGPDRTLIFEDSTPGVRAALSCGAGVCRVMAFPRDMAPAAEPRV